MSRFNAMAAGLLLLTLPGLNGCKKYNALQEELLNPGMKQTLFNISYGSNKRNVMDVTLPAHRNFNTPVVIFIHGGSWTFGDKAIFAQELDKYANAGFACATINYRYASDKNNVHHPELPADVQTAVDFIAARAVKWNVSPNSFALVGHSAGAQLALIVSYANTDGKIKACASWSGPLDLVDKTQMTYVDCFPIFSEYMGRGLHSAADTLAYKQASPYWQVKSTSVPTLLIHGTDDKKIPFNVSASMNEKLERLGVLHEFHSLNGAGHIFMGEHVFRASELTFEWIKRVLPKS